MVSLKSVSSVHDLVHFDKSSLFSKWDSDIYFLESRDKWTKGETAQGGGKEEDLTVLSGERRFLTRSHNAYSCCWFNLLQSSVLEVSLLPSSKHTNIPLLISNPPVLPQDKVQLHAPISNHIRANMRRTEYHNKTLTRLIGGNSLHACYVLAGVIFGIGILRDWL